MLSRHPLASLVCPSIPFLAPRLLRTAVPATVLASRCAPTTAGFRRPTYATKAKGKKKSQSPRIPLNKNTKKLKFPSPTEVALQQFRTACDVRSIKTLMEMYPNLLQYLDPSDTRRIVRALHACIRINNLADVKISDIYPFVEQVVADIRSGALPPHPYTHVHLLGIYKDSKKYDEGYAFWQWLVEQDETYVSQEVYGAAIELMAYGRIRSLRDLEEIYIDGLKRFPGTFAEYHLSPDAIVPDRTQWTSIIGLPVLLLQGILTARILSRDWKNAYLAFDTALRLYPTQVPSRYFELFMTERPLFEAYTTYLIACRAGVVFRPSHLTALITKLRAAMASSSSLPDRMMFLRGIANAMYAYLEAGGTLKNVHVAAFLTAFENLLPEIAIGQDYRGEAAVLRNSVVVTAHEILSTLLQAGMPPQHHSFIALVNLAGRLRVPDLLNVTLKDIQTARVKLESIGNRSVLTSAGILKNKGIIEEFWARIVSEAETEGKSVSYKDWVTFVKACRRADHTDYFKEQLQKLQHAINANEEKRCLNELNREDIVDEDQSFVYMDVATLASEIEELKKQIRNIATVFMSGQPLDLRTSPFYMFLDPTRLPLASKDDLRAVYDEFTTDPHQPPPQPLPADSPLKTPLSPTGIPLDELRFQNWLSIAELMLEADAHEQRVQNQINFAIKTGQPLDQTSNMFQFCRRDVDMEFKTRGGLRERIKQLRTPTSSGPPHDRL